MVGFFSGCGAFGDQAFNLCQIYGICTGLGIPSVTLHTSREFFYQHSENDFNIIPPNPNVLMLWSQCSLIKSVSFDINHRDFENSLDAAANGHSIYLKCPISWKSKRHRIGDWLHIKRKYDLDGNKIAIFQPISLALKPVGLKHRYIMKWDMCLKTLLDKGYMIYAIGSEEDANLLDTCVKRELSDKIVKLFGIYSMIDVLGMILHQANFVLSCDSWSGLFGIANRIPTCIAWGARIKDGIDSHYVDYLGNEDVYCQGWAEDSKATDLKFSKWIEKNF